MTAKVDVAIIGASAAGSSLAFQLGRAGLSVLLADQSSFPRRKACGEGLSVLGLREIERAGIQLPSDLPARPFHGFRFFDGKRISRIEANPNGSPAVHGIAVARYHLDSALLAASAGLENIVTILGTQPAVRRSNDGFFINTGYRSFAARFLVLATGQNSTLPRQLGVPEISHGAGRCGLTLEIKTPAIAGGTDSVDVVQNEKFEVCCTRTGATRVNLSFLAHASNAALFRRSNIKPLFSMIRDITGIAGEIAGDPLVVSGICRTQRPANHRAVFLVGDAVRQLDPIGGMGITQALAGARIVAQTLVALVRGEATQRAAAEKSHAARMRRELRNLCGYTHLTYWSLVSPLGKTVLGEMKCGRVAAEVLNSMHRSPSWISPAGAASRILVSTAGRLS